MRYVATGLLSALMFIGCGGDDDGSTAAKPDGSVVDAGKGGLDASSGHSDAGALAGASATLAAKSGSMTVGSATFALIDGVVTLTLNVTGATPGQHGVHLHVTGDCSADNASSAGGHWNPDLHPHGSGSLDAGAISHLGDLGNIIIGADGSGTLTRSNAEWKLGDGSTDDVVGHAIVVHKNQDDLVTQERADAGITPGNSDGRISCGVITK